MRIQSETVERQIDEYSLTTTEGAEFWGHFDHRAAYGGRVEQVIIFDKPVEYVQAWVTTPGDELGEAMFHVLSVERGGKKVRVLFEALKKSDWLTHNKSEHLGKPVDYRIMLSGKFKAA